MAAVSGAIAKFSAAMDHVSKTFDESDFDKIYPSNKMSYYEHIHGIIQHDAYHLGQIVLLTKLV